MAVSDTGFGTNGIVTPGIGTNTSAVLSLESGHVLIASHDNDASALRLQRLNTDGTVDTSFGNGGVTEIEVQGDWGWVTDMVTNAAGQILVASASNDNLSIRQFEANGKPLTNFGRGGVADVPFSSDDGAPSNLAIQDDGRILIAGRHQPDSGGGGGEDFGLGEDGADDKFAVARFKASGRLDRSFGNRGVATIDIPDGVRDNAFGVALRSDGSITVSGSVRVIVGFDMYGEAMYNTDFAITLLDGGGDLQSSFGDDGIVVEGFTIDYPTSESAESLVIQADGKIIVGGSFYNGTDTDFAIMRYHANGQLDTTFGNNGVTVVDLNGNYDDLLITSTGKIVAVGATDSRSAGSETEFLAVRLNADGSLDSTFDGGIVTVGVFEANVYGNAVAEDSNGNMVIVGNAYSTAGRFMAVRLDNSGALDTSFDEDGIAFTGFGNSGSPYDVVVQPDDKIAIFGYTSSPSNFEVHRLNVNGSSDTSFGSGGKAVVSFSSSYDNPRAMTIQDDGKLVLVGESRVGGIGSFGIARLNTNGSLDSTFGSGGKVTTNFGYWGNAEGVHVQPDGKIIVVGSHDNGGEFIVARYLSNGSLDMTFGTDGKADIDFGSNNERANTVGFSNGRIVIGGFAGNHADIALARLVSETTVVADAYDNTYSTGEDSSAGGNVLLDDTGQGADASPLALTVLSVNGDPSAVGQAVTLASGGLLTVKANGSFVYAPNGQFNHLAAGQQALETFTYQIDDGHGGPMSATVTIVLVGQNDLPHSFSGNLIVSEEESASLSFTTANGDPDDGDLVSVVAATITAGLGQITEVAGEFIYDPTVAYDGLHYGEEAFVTIEVNLRDVLGGESTGTLNTTVTGVNDAVRAFLVGNTLMIEGTAKRDDIRISQSASGIVVVANRANLGTFTVDDFQALGLGGDDAIRTAKNVTVGGTYDGGEGNDQIVGGSGNDLIIGGGGNDRLDGGQGDDTLHGNEGDDKLNGKQGNDVLFGGAGSDRLTGSSGNDQLFGGDDDDRLSGGSGDDLLDGGPGDDRISEGPGNDTVID